MLPIRPIILNVYTATCEVAHYLAQLLLPLSCPVHSESSSHDFVNTIKERVIPNVYKLVSFDVKTLFICVPSDHFIN